MFSNLFSSDKKKEEKVAKTHATKEFTDANFQEMVLSKKGVTVIDFWAEWCGPCRLIGPIVQELAGEYGDQVNVGKLDVDANPEVAMKYMIRSIPTILILKDGEVVNKHVGTTSKSVLKAKIDAHL